jgi:GNAT superfamily N-acetyltransferase
VNLRHARRTDLGLVADLWVDAFRADPYFRWIAPGDAAWSQFGTAWMTLVAELSFQRGHLYVAEPLDVAVAWIPPDRSLIGPAEIDRAAGILFEHGGEQRAAEAIGTVMEARGHIAEDTHWTLQYLGVRQARSGRGLGAAAVAPMLSVIDSERLPTALVSTNTRNVAFYQRLGFVVTAEVSTPGGEAVLRPMHRAAATG